MLDDGRKQSAEKTVNALRAAALASGIPFLLAAGIALGTLGGGWLDKQWGTQPWLTVVGALLGVAAGMVQVFRLVAQMGTGKRSRGK